MSYIIGIILGILILAPILIAFYYDYKSDPKEFSLSLKTLKKGLLKGLIFAGIYFGANALYKVIVPFNKNYGIEFNAEREKLGLTQLQQNWDISDHESGQFISCWQNPESENIHFKKTIEYGLLHPKYETDYYHNKNRKDTFAWSIYDFSRGTFEYFMEKPNNNIISVNEKGKLKYEKPTEIVKIGKTEFEKYTAE